MKRYSYIQIWNEGNPIHEHRIVYEQYYGSIPKGFHIHHRNEKTKDNNPANLEALSPGDHKKIHSKSYIRRTDDGWDKICHSCGIAKSLNEFHTHNKGITHRRDCKSCRNKIEGQRLARRKAEDPEFRERQRQCVRNWYARKKATTAPAV